MRQQPNSLPATEKLKDNRVRIVIYCVVTALYWFAMYVYAPYFSPYLESLGASHKMIGLIVGSYGFAQIALRIPIGLISDKFQKRKIFVLSGVAASFISSLGLALFPQIPLILLFRILAGVAAAAWVVFSVMFTGFFREEQSANSISLITAASYVGQLTAMLVGGLTAQRWGVGLSFYLAAAGGLLAVLLSFSIAESPAAPQRFSGSGKLQAASDIWYFIKVSLMGIVIQIITFATIYGFTPVVAKNLGADYLQISMLAILSVLPGVISSAISVSFFANHLGEGLSLSAGFVILSATSIIIPLLNSLEVLYIVQLAVGFGRGLVFTLLMGMSIKGVHPERKATFMGIYQAVYAVGILAGPVVMGIISDSVGLSWGFWIMGIVSFCAAVASYFFFHTYTAEQRQRSTRL